MSFFFLIPFCFKAHFKCSFLISKSCLIEKKKKEKQFRVTFPIIKKEKLPSEKKRSVEQIEKKKYNSILI